MTATLRLIVVNDINLNDELSFSNDDDVVAPFDVFVLLRTVVFL